MRILLVLLLITAFRMPERCVAQQSEAEGKTLPEISLPQEALASSTSANCIASPKKEIYWNGWLRFGPNVLKDQKAIWTFPVSVAKGQHIKPTFAVMGITAGLVALDPFSGRYFQKTQAFNGFNRVFSGKNTAIGMFAAPIAFYGVSLIRKDAYDQKTFLLAGEAALSSAILTTVIKDVTRRLNPADVPLNGDFSDIWFKKSGEGWKGGIGSFPSGHTSAAFAVATVFAKRYPNHRWVRWAAYGLAALIGFSRVPLESHFPSDVFFGAVLGYAIASHAVRRGP
jgi:membrane-associated phospholipid phosphatase